MSGNTQRFHFVTLTEKSAPEIFEIERKARSHPMSEQTIAGCFGRLYHNIGVYLGDRLIGFAIVHQVIDEATLTDICVAPDAQGSGHGKALMSQVISTSKQRGAAVLRLEVRASNTNAVKLYKKAGFAETGRRADYYPAKSGREDAILMELRC